MTGKTVLVTGATNGIGEACARALAADGARVLAHGRSKAKGEALVARIKDETPGADVEFVQADFAELASVRALADQVLARAPRLDVLLNNAGLLAAPERQLTTDGFETTFAVNQLAPFLLTHLLLDRLKACAPARIVNTASFAHRFGRIDFDNLQGERRYRPMDAYAVSKLANILFTRSLARRLEGTQVTANALHPGGVRTGLGMDNPGNLNTVFRVMQRFMISAEDGAKTSLHLATSPAVQGVSGAYFAKCRQVTPSAAAQDDAMAERLWQASAEMTGLA